MPPKLDWVVKIVEKHEKSRMRRARWADDNDRIQMISGWKSWCETNPTIMKSKKWGIQRWWWRWWRFGI